MRAVDTILSPIAEQTGGAVRWYADGLPGIRRLARGRRGDADSFTLAENNASRVTSVEQTPLLPPWLALLLLLGTLLFAWREEGK